MADEQLTSPVETSPEPSAPAEQATETSPEQPQQQTQPEKAVSQTEPKQTEAKPKVNLFESEEFRQYQAQQTRNFQQLQERARQAEDRLRQQEMAGLDDHEKLQYQLQEQQKAYQELQQRLQMQEMAAQRERDIVEIIDTTGTPRELIESAENVYDAWKLAASYVRKSATEQAKMEAAAQAEKVAANSVDVGGGEPSTPNTRWNEQASNLLKQKDAAAYVKHLFTQE